MFDFNSFTKQDFTDFLSNLDDDTMQKLMQESCEIRAKYYGKEVYTRGLIEFTNCCKNDCYYCGIRNSNKNAERYRLSKDQILECCDIGYKLNFRTFVLQGGEDTYYTDDILTDIISTIKEKYPDCALTLSFGERSFDSYKKLYVAGVNRYLLRQETSNEEHYKMLHPKIMSLTNRKDCLYNLKKIGYQVGAGFLVGSPYQTLENIAEDLLFLKELQPQMVGIGPFIPQKDTPFKDFKNGSVELTLTILAIIRILLPTALIPATTALGTLDKNGREKAMNAGANVVMPNLSPLNVKKKYTLYDNKICTGDEVEHCVVCLKNRIKKAGYEINFDRGDHINWRNK